MISLQAILRVVQLCCVSSTRANDVYPVWAGSVRGQSMCGYLSKKCIDLLVGG